MKRVTEVNLIPATNGVSFTGEMHCAETGEDKEFSGVNAATIRRLIACLMPGDTLTVKLQTF